MAAFEAGELSQLSLPSADVQRIIDSGAYEIFKYLRKGVGLFLEFNVTKEPFDDLELRKALNYAIDKETIVDVALEGLGEPTYGVLAPSLRGYWPGIVDYAPHYDPAKAAEILDANGWVMNEATGIREKDGVPLTFTLYNAPIAQWESSAQLIQAQLKEVGIEMEIQVFEFGTLLEKLKAGEQQAGLMGYTYATPDIVYLWFHSDNIGTGLTLSHYSDPELDQLIVDSRTKTDWAVREEIYKEIQKLITDVALWVPIYTQYYYIAIQDNAADAQVHPDGYMILNDAYIVQ
jgi:peptide/nickel transport system substrate-binding protein